MLCAVCSAQYAVRSMLCAVCCLVITWFSLLFSNYFCFQYPFHIRFLVFYVCFIFCVFVLFLLFLHSCLFPNFVQVYRPLPPGGNPIAVTIIYHIIYHHISSYRIISYIISCHVMSSYHHIISYHIPV
jgi:hypothetical protein